jgi:sulfhydrogenase subunit beta (sulfur reductase)
MAIKIFTPDEWIKALEALQKTYRIYVPARDGEFHSFKALEQVKRPDFLYQNTRLSPKSIVFPESERMLECSLDPHHPEAHTLKESPKDYSPQAIVGIRPCDVHAFQIVRLNFENPDCSDPLWVRRFESTVLVGLGCTRPYSTCFCTSVGGGPFHEHGLDVLVYPMGKEFLAKSLTPQGERFLKNLQEGRPVDSSLLEQAQSMAASASEKITASVPTERLKEKSTTELFEAPFWDDAAFACLNCGTCTYLCPTCWCFDIQDEAMGSQGDRIRNWDSCMFPLFTLHGSGHNPREKKVQRVRQRFMHKLKYYVEKYQNGVQCSGCGRCVRYCPVNIDIREIFRLMNGV